MENGIISLISAEKENPELDHTKKNKIQVKITTMFCGCYIDRMAIK